MQFYPILSCLQLLPILSAEKNIKRHCKTTLWDDMCHAVDQMVAMSLFSAVRRIASVWISMEKRFLKVENLPWTLQTAPSLVREI